jgi:hypothetical protein
MTCCVRREVRSQAVRERRSGLDLATVSVAHLRDGGDDEGPGRTDARGSIRGVESAFGFQRSRKTSCAIRQKASWSGGCSPFTGRVVHASGRCGEALGSSQDGPRRKRAVRLEPKSACRGDDMGRQRSVHIRVRLLQPQARGVGEIETIQPSAGNRARGSTKHRSESAEVGASEQQHPLFPPHERELVGVSRRRRHDTQMPGVCSKHHTAGGE